MTEIYDSLNIPPRVTVALKNLFASLIKTTLIACAIAFILQLSSVTFSFSTPVTVILYATTSIIMFAFLFGHLTHSIDNSPVNRTIKFSITGAIFIGGGLLGNSLNILSTPVMYAYIHTGVIGFIATVAHSIYYLMTPNTVVTVVDSHER